MLLPATLLVLTLLSEAPAPSAAARQKATALNAQGFRLYRQKKFPEALALFQQAFEADPTHAMSHYNYAATLGVLRKANRTCEFDAYKQAIVNQLTQAVRLDPSRRARMVKDPDFDEVRDTVGYQKLLGLDPQKDLAALLEKVSWYSGGEGAYGSMLQLDFQPAGKLVATVRELTGDDRQQVKPRTQTGTWRVDAGKIHVELPGHAPSAADGRLSPEGVLELPPLGKLYDRPSECEA